MAIQTVTIEHDDHPEEVTWKFVHALQALGIEVNKIENDGPVLEYEIILNKNKASLEELNPFNSKGLKV